MSITIRTHSFRRVPITLEERKKDINDYLKASAEDRVKLRGSYEKKLSKLLKIESDLIEELKLIEIKLNEEQAPIERVMEFTTGEWFKVSGKGNVFATEMPESIHGLVNRTVKIQGHLYYVVGVELTAKANNTLYKGRSVALQVRGEIKV